MKAFKEIRVLFTVLGILSTLGTAQAATLHVGKCWSTQGGSTLDAEWCWGDDNEGWLYTSFGETHKFSIMQTPVGTHNISWIEAGNEDDGIWEVRHSGTFVIGEDAWILKGRINGISQRDRRVGMCSEETLIKKAASHEDCKNHVKERTLKGSVGG